MKPLNFLWIDDDPQRVKNFQSLIERPTKKPRAKVVPHSVQNKDVVTEIPIILNGPKPDLCIIDHVFSNAGGNGFREGSTVAAALRENWNDVPIVGVTAALKVASKRKHFDRLKAAEYIDLFDWDHFDQAIPDLFVICNDFKKLLGAQLDKPNKLLELLQCKVDGDLLISILPTEFKDQPDAGTPHIFARWVLHNLIALPGFLYDDQWTATMLGLNLKGFGKVKKLFTKCGYNGVFASSARPRWWPKLIRSELYDLLPKENSNLPWVVGRFLPGLTKNDFSKCYICADAIPETMAYPDETSDQLFPVCIKHTMPHPKSTAMIGFEEMRIFRPT